MPNKTEVINAHKCGGVEKLLPPMVYIGRPSPYGNTYSSNSGLLSKEECVAYNRVDLYKSLIETPSLLDTLKRDLKDKILVCWCKQAKYHACCHGDNYVHIFEDDLLTRTYDRTVLFYLMDDLKRSLARCKEYLIRPNWSYKYNLDLAIHEISLELWVLFEDIKEKNIHSEMVCKTLSPIIIDLESILFETSEERIHYRLHHCLWNIHRFIFGVTTREYEPLPPKILKTPSLKRKVINKD